jgi:protein-tyrosine phosphatase
MAVKRPSRHLDWEGCWNARDLGGLRTRGGRVTRLGAVVRSENLSLLTPAGWSALVDYGVRTIIDLRSPDAAQAVAVAPGIVVVRSVPMDDGLGGDPEYLRWDRTRELSTPLYYRRFLTRWPELVGNVLRAVAEAPPGGVVLHCQKGRDRTGLASLVLLLTAGVAHHEIAADYEATAERVRLPIARKFGAEDTTSVSADVLARHGKTMRETLMTTLEWLEEHLDERLSAGGVSSVERQTIVARLVG